MLSQTAVDASATSVLAANSFTTAARQIVSEAERLAALRTDEFAVAAEAHANLHVATQQIEQAAVDRQDPVLANANAFPAIIHDDTIPAATTDQAFQAHTDDPDNAAAADAVDTAARPLLRLPLRPLLRSWRLMSHLSRLSSLTPSLRVSNFWRRASHLSAWGAAAAGPQAVPELGHAKWHGEPSISKSPKLKEKEWPPLGCKPAGLGRQHVHFRPIFRLRRAVAPFPSIGAARAPSL